MPGKRGKKSRPVCKRAEPTSDDDSANDASSVTSGLSETRSVLDGIDNNEVCEVQQQQELELKILRAFDGLFSKNSKDRVLCFMGVEKILTAKYVPHIVESHVETLTESVTKGLKKGGGQEQLLAARISTLICSQLDTFDEIETVNRGLKSTLSVLANDINASPDVRSECIWALSNNQFFSGNSLGDAIKITKLLSNIFSGSFFNESGDEPTLSVEMAKLYASAISSWTLLLTVMDSSDIYSHLSSERKDSYMPSLNNLQELLLSTHLEIRLSAGEALAVIFELGRDYDIDYEQNWAMELIEILKDLASDSKKSRSKKDRCHQRAFFRDVLTYIEDDILPETKVHFGTETLYLDGWCARAQYNACCRLLGPGINTHLAENQLIREIFDLGERLQPGLPRKKQNKLKKTLMNSAACKQRTLLRGKNRDKRLASFEYED